ncbi:MAG: hypothetical protein H0U61_14975, partial [Nocardioidaceae bacterium]|nr:hypothetical protein [Nocardioidaceae bacterium]
MSTVERDVAAARFEAMGWQAAARNRADTPDPDTLDREAVASLGSPGASTASALLSLTGWPAIALDDALSPSSAPLATAAAVFEHYRNRHHDGAGLELGVKPGGVFAVAVTRTAKAWEGWRDDVAVVRVHRDFGDSRSAEDVSLRDLGAFAACSWQPASPSFRSSGVTAAPTMPRSYGTAEPGWLLWAVAPEPGRRITFPDKRKLGHGLTLLGEGVVPFHATRRDGWTLRSSGVPQPAAMPDWLV